MAAWACGRDFARSPWCAAFAGADADKLALELCEASENGQHPRGRAITRAHTAQGSTTQAMAHVMAVIELDDNLSNGKTVGAGPMGGTTQQIGDADMAVSKALVACSCARRPSCGRKQQVG
jgi:hypothetical protein